MKPIETIMLQTIQGAATSKLQTALTGVTSALDSLKASQRDNGSLTQLLPVAIMAKWIQNR